MEQNCLHCDLECHLDREILSRVNTIPYKHYLDNFNPDIGWIAISGLSNNG